jgi:hypothetical protein
MEYDTNSLKYTVYITIEWYYAIVENMPVIILRETQYNSAKNTKNHI